MKHMIHKTICLLLAVCLAIPLFPALSVHAEETKHDGWTYLDFTKDFGTYTYEDTNGDGEIQMAETAVFGGSFSSKQAQNNIRKYNTYRMSEDGKILTIGVPADKTTATGDGGIYSDTHKLEPGKEYIVSVKAKFASAYTTDQNCSAAAGLVFGISGVEDGIWKSPWSANCYTAMFTAETTEAETAPRCGSFRSAIKIQALLRIPQSRIL